MHGRALIVVVAVLVAGCGGGVATTPSPSAASLATPTATATPSPAQASPAAVSPSPVVSPPAAEGPIDILPGDPWLVYAWYPESLFLVRPDGSDRHRLDLGIPGEPFAPSWSADGERLAFAMRDETTPNGSIWASDADGSGAEPLYDGDGDCNFGAFWPQWSPDGSQLAMVCYHGTEAEAYTSVSLLDPVTSERTDLVDLLYPMTIDNPPSWSPDASALTFEIITWDPTDQFVQESVVATIPTAGGEIARLTDPTLFAGHPDWSPDGSLITFNTYDTGNMHGIAEPSNVYTIAPDGSGLRQVSTASKDGFMRLGQPFWSADGSRIWVSIARDWEKDSTGQFSNTLGWVDAATGALTEVGTEGKRFRERPAP